MKRQSGTIKLEATLDDLTYYKRNGVFLVKKKSAVSRSRLKYSPQYAAFRQHQQDFSRAARGGKLIRNALASLAAPVSDANCVARMTTAVLNVIQSDHTNPVGQRSVLNGDLNLLKGFEFNTGCALTQVLKAPFRLKTVAATNSVSLEIPVFKAAKHLRSPRNASHFQVVLGVASMDFNSGTYQTAFSETGQMSAKSSLGTSLSLNCLFHEFSTNPLLVVVGLRFSQYINGSYEPIQNGGYQALSMVGVLKPEQLPAPVVPGPLTDEAMSLSTLDTGQNNPVTVISVREGGTKDGGTNGAGTIDGGTIDGGTINGGTINGGTIDGGIIDGGIRRASYAKARLPRGPSSG